MSQDFGYLTLEEIKQAVALDRLKKFENNITQTAKSLKVTRPTLHKILKDYDKRTDEEKKRIEANMTIDQRNMSQERGAFEADPVTGMSIPKAPAPLPKIPLIMPKELVQPTGAIDVTADQQPRPANAFKPVVKPSPIIPEPNSIETEAKREHDRFEKLDKTPYSLKHKMEARAILEKGKTPKAKGKKNTKKEKVKAK